MKHFKIIISMAIAVICFTAANAQNEVSKNQTEKTMAYRCPMKCERDKTYNNPGKCPKCGMKLKGKPAVAPAAVFQCPMKCEDGKTYAKAGKCPVCSMDLKPTVKQNATVAMYQCPMKCEGEKMYDKAGKCPKCNMDLAKAVIKKDASSHKGHNHN